jgi:Uma2 family endonuclease
LTLRRPDLDRGLESDQCYCIANESRVRGKTAIDLASNPPPDLFVEIEVSRTILDRIAVAAALGVREIWRFDGTKLQIGPVQPDGQYTWRTTSEAFPGIRMDEIVRFLRMAQTTGHLDVLRALRARVRSQVPSGASR